MTTPNCPQCGEPMEFVFTDVDDDEDWIIVDVYQCADCETEKTMVAEDYLPDDDEPDYDEEREPDPSDQF